MLQAGRTTPAPAPPASPIDPAVFLEALLSPEVDFVKLAARLSVPLQDLAALATHPAILSYLAAIDELADLRFRLIAADARLAAIKALTGLLNAPNADPVERRRVAALLLRALNRPANNGYAQIARGSARTDARTSAPAVRMVPTPSREHAGPRPANDPGSAPMIDERADSETLAPDTFGAPSPASGPCSTRPDPCGAPGTLRTPCEVSPHDRASTRVTQTHQSHPRSLQPSEPVRWDSSRASQRKTPSGLLAVAGHASPALYSRRARAP